MTRATRPLIIPVFLPHVGCPHRCVFCDQSTITGVSPSPICREDVHRQITSFFAGCRPSSRPCQIAFYGGNFLGLKKSDITALLSEATGFVTRKHAHGIRFSTRPDTINEASLALLTPFPVHTVELGVQSMDDRVLDLSHRGHSATDTRQSTELLKKEGYQIGFQIMVGLPGDDEETAMATARHVAQLAPDFVRIYPTVVLAGSQLARQFESGAYAPWSLGRAVSLVKRLVMFFQDKHIKVIRMGLQPTQDLEQGGSIVAGPFHPSFGHLVYSEILLDNALEATKSCLAAKEIELPLEATLKVHPRCVSQVRGIKNENIRRLKRACGIQKINIQEDPDVAEGQVVVSQYTTGTRSQMPGAGIE